MSSLNSVKFTVNKTGFLLLRGDVVEQDTEAIVNAANSSLSGGDGLKGAIHRAGGTKIDDECAEIIARIGKLPPGEAVVTSGGNLRAGHVIHTVGPVWGGGDQHEDAILKNAYVNSLELARNKGFKTISFPSISTGSYRYPLKAAAEVAIKSIVDYVRLNGHFEEVRLVLWNNVDFQIYQSVAYEVLSFAR